MRRALLLILFVFAAILFTACGGDDEAIEVRMLDNLFSPAVIEVPVGGSVTFVNDGRAPHNAVDVEGRWSTEDVFGDLTMLNGDSATVTFDEPGVYDFICTFHATEQGDGTYVGMVGTIIVGDSTDALEVAVADTAAPTTWTGDTRLVPVDYPTIQSAVDAAAPGDLVLIEPGVYKEAVSVTTPGLTIRGTDRNEVVLDGELTRENGIAATADGVAVENLTVRGYTINGVFWNGVTGYRGSYITSIDNWVYGIYAFDSVDGLIEHSYASGSWDAGYYIGQCDPCNAVITDVVGEFNGLGYSGTNSSGNIYLVNSEYRYNVAGVVPNTLDSELLPPSHDVVVAGNYIHHNGETERAPTGKAEWSAFGNGVVLAGSRNSVVRDNLLINNATSGVLVTPMIDANFWPSVGNEVRNNYVRGSGRSDLALAGPADQGSCFADNDFETKLPVTLSLLHNCDGLSIQMPFGLAAAAESLGRIAQAEAGGMTDLAHGDAPDPGPQMPMPGGAGADVRPAVDVFNSLNFDPAAITLPDLPADVDIQDADPYLFGVSLTSGFWPIYFGVLMSWIPWLVWIVGGVWALRRIWTVERSTRARVVWTAAVTLVPVLGVLLFGLFVGRSMRPRRRWAIVGGGLVLWVIVVIASLLLGGVL